MSFPAYSPDRLDRVFGTLAAEAGFTLEPAAAEKAAAVLAAARNGNGSGRLAVALLGHAAIAQACRLGEDSDPLLITAADIPDQVALRGPAAEGPGL